MVQNGVTLNGSKRGDNTSSARGVYINQYMAQYIPIIKSHPEWQGLDASGGQTIAQREKEYVEAAKALGERTAAILMVTVFLTSQAALLRTEWLNAAVVHRLARVDLVYGVAALLRRRTFVILLLQVGF